MKKGTLMYLSFYSQIKNGQFFKVGRKIYKYVGYITEQNSIGETKYIVTAKNMETLKYEAIDCSYGTKMYDKEVTYIV